MSLLPHNDSAQSPFVWLVNFDEGSGFTGSLEMAIADGAEWEMVNGSLAWFELGAWRAVNAFHPGIPWRLVELERGAVGCGTYGMSVPEHPATAQLLPTNWAAGLDVVGMAGDDLEGIAADRAGACDAVSFHPQRIASDATHINGAGTPLFTSFPPAEPPEDMRMADLFTDMAAD